ncbi:MAG: hypothetical protein JRG96_06205 [Deltaproteobacteria bacterium]|nr:hypothetical protein [Deltaproteobacteria bacterium]MBW2417269.1 hypothetical protein [Deltaproteobacteria bacterium]
MESTEPERVAAPVEGRGKRRLQVGFGIFVVAGLIAGLTLLPAEWSWMRRSLGGLVIGTGIALMIFGWRLLVYDDGDDDGYEDEEG